MLIAISIASNNLLCMHGKVEEEEAMVEKHTGGWKSFYTAIKIKCKQLIKSKAATRQITRKSTQHYASTWTITFPACYCSSLDVHFLQSAICSYEIGLKSMKWHQLMLLAF